ncbi:MAG: hypothetical protein QXG44_03445 [Candidatus Jordarchaeaceae archaeon]
MPQQKKSNVFSVASSARKKGLEEENGVRKLKIFFVVFFSAIVLGMGLAAANVYRVPEQNFFAGLLIWGVDSKSCVKSQELYDWDEILKPVMENQTLSELASFISNGFREWAMQDKNRYLELLIYPDRESSKTYFYQFLTENPEYKNTIMQYVDMISEIHASLVPTLSQEYCDLIVEKGEVTDEWQYNTTIEGNEFTVTCTAYELKISGTVQKLVKANFYNSEGVLIADPYAGVYLYYIPAYAWPWGWIVIGEDWFFNVRFTYPNESEFWFMTAQTFMNPGSEYRDILNVVFPTIAGYLVGGICGALVGIFTGYGLTRAEDQEVMYLRERTYYAWGMSHYENWGVQCQLRVRMIYPWTVYFWIPSYFMIGYVLYNGAYVQGLPNTYTRNAPLIAVGGLVAYAVAHFYDLSNLRSNLQLWGATLGLNRMVWMGTWP